MAGDFDYDRYDMLRAQGLSERKAFEHMGVKRSTGQDALKRRSLATITPAAVRPLSPAPEAPVPAVVHDRQGTLPSDGYGASVPAVLDDVKGDLLDMALWWRERKLRLAQPRQERDTIRWTIHIDPVWKERVMELSDAQRTSLTDVVDDIFRVYFERT
jgi:hypothetical protein